MTIGTVGIWHLGEVYSTCLASLGYQVIGFDKDKKNIDNLNRGVPPLPEPKIKPLLSKYLKSKQLKFSADFNQIKKCQVIWLTIDTPVNNLDRANLKPVFTAIKKVLPHLRQHVLIIVSSQIPVGTSKKIVELIKKIRPSLKFDYAYLPENLRLGQAVEGFLNPDRVIVGVQSSLVFSRIKKLLIPLNTKLIQMDLASAEMLKHATNAFLATSLSFTNDLADLCEAVNANIVEVTSALRLDQRIGPYAYLGAGLGFSGATLSRDLVSLLDAGKGNHLKLPVIKSVLSKNRSRPKLVISKLKTHLKTLNKKRITILGLTYKAGTSTLRRSMPLSIAFDLASLGVQVKLFDKDVNRKNIPAHSKAKLIDDPYKAVNKSHVLIIATPKPEFKKLNLSKLRQQMVKPAIFFDPYNLFADQKEKFKKADLSYLGVGCV